MDRFDQVMQQASEVCWMLFGVDYHLLEIQQWPRIASYYVAKRMLAGEGNLFQSLQEIADAVHVYNRNLITSLQAHNDDNEAAEEIAARGILHLEGRDYYERITGKRAPEGFRHETGQARKEPESMD